MALTLSLIPITICTGISITNGIVLLYGILTYPAGITSLIVEGNI
jgi:hypothetical protein